MFWTEDGRGKKEKGKEKSVVTWVDEKKRGEKKKILLYIHCPFLSFIPQKATFISATQTLSFFIMHFFKKLNQTHPNYNV